MASGYKKIIIATILFSLGPIFVRKIPMDGVTIFWWLSFIGMLLLVAKLLLESRFQEILKLRRKTLLVLFSLGLFTSLNNSFFNISVKTTTIANAVLTHYLAPIFLIFLGLYFFKQRIEKLSITALFLALFGFIILLLPQKISFDNSHFVGLTFGTISAVFLLLRLLQKRFSRTITMQKLLPSGFLRSLLSY